MNVSETIETEADKGETAKKGWLSRLRSGLAKSTKRVTESITGLFTKKKLDQETLNELEDALIQADLGVNVAARLVEKLGKERFGKEVTDEEVRIAFADDIAEILQPVATSLTIDPARKHAELTFNDASAELLGADGEGWRLLERLYDAAAVYFSFAQVGGAEAAMWMARDYALQRQAFGRAIGSYQAIKHKLADCYVKLELARSNAYYGAMMLTDGGADLPLAAAAARIAATEAYDFAAKENIQTHGGIGFTWEADTQFHYRRARVMALSIGGPMAWKDKLVSRLEQKNAA